MQIVVDNILTNYESVGKGKPILLLHGWADRLETFRPLIPKLAEAYQLISMDLPGFGKTEAPNEAWDLSNYAQFLHKFLNKIEVKPYAIIGHSNGGALAIHAVARGKVKPQKLILLSSSGVRDTQSLRRLGIKAVAKIGKIMTFWMPPSSRHKLQKALYGTVGSDMFAAEQLRETFKLTVRQDIQKDASQLTLPTLLIYGSQDKATPIDEIGQKLHALIKDSKLEIIYGADHFAHQEHAHRMGGLIKEFLDK